MYIINPSTYLWCLETLSWLGLYL